MYTIAVTGGNGLVGRYVVQRLLNNEHIAEIRIIDRQCSSNDIPRLKQFEMDLNDKSKLEKVLEGCDVVVNCAHAEFPIRSSSTFEERQQMWRDNLDAVEILVDSMEKLGVRKLVNVGCAYCSIPNEDNYGLAQDVFLDYPRNYMLDQYGESRTRGEKYARKAVEKGNIDGIFLRPTFVYGQGISRKMEHIKKLIEDDQFPYIEGDRRGLHQFIYAGNLASIIEKSVFGLMIEPKRFNGEIVFCMDETCAYPIRLFFENRFQHKNYCSSNVKSFWSSFIKSYANYWKSWIGLNTTPVNTLNHVAFRLFFEKTVGFPNKKLRLLLDHKPEITQEEAFEKFVNPKASLPFETLPKRRTVYG